MANRRETAVFRQKDEWLYECIEKIVRLKKAAGIRTSFSYELIRLAANGLTGEMIGAEIDRKILKGTKDDGGGDKTESSDGTGEAESSSPDG